MDLPLGATAVTAQAEASAAARTDSVPVDAVRVSEVVIVGTGVAGLAAALGSSPRAVTVLTKSRLGEGGSSAWAQGGVAVAVGEDDSPELHARDTLAVGGGLSDPDIVALLTREGPVRIQELIDLGARFDRQGRLAGAGEPALALGREAAHSRRRILHAGGDATGAELVRALTAAVRQAPGVRVAEECFAVDLALETQTDGRRRVVGVLALESSGRRVLHLGGAVVLATGGIGQLFRYTTNPGEVTGDGLAMAARAGARLVDLEMVQFHPTALSPVGRDETDETDRTVGGPLPLLTEALRGEGAVLVDGSGHRFMLDEHPDAELAPRDVVARAIHRRREAGEAVFLDARAAVGERFPERFPTVFEKAMAAGLDPRVEPLPVTPAAHYHMGGVEVDERGRASLPGLWVCGEAASTGAHGANRLASNSLLEALVFGARVAKDMASGLTGLPGGGAEQVARLRFAGRRVEWLPNGLAAGRAAEVADAAAGTHLADLIELRSRVRRVMWRHVGLLRDASGLSEAAKALEKLNLEAASVALRVEAAGRFAEQVHLHETRNLLLAGRLVTAAARARTESRGAHRREDHPAEKPSWRRHLYPAVDDAGRLRISAGPLLVEDELPPASEKPAATLPCRARSRPPLARPAVAAWGAPR